MTKKECIEEWNLLNIEITPLKLEKLDIVFKEMINTNKYLNLTRITEEKDVYLKHFYDSLTLVKIYDFTSQKTLCDIGTGAGFPGLILKIFYDNLEVSLVDSLQKRVNYLNNLISKLNLKGIKAYHKRAEELIKENKKYDIVTARAVARLSKLLPITMPLLKDNGSFLAMKGKATIEIEEAKSLMKKNKWYIERKEFFCLPNKEDERTILEIKTRK